MHSSLFFVAHGQLIMSDAFQVRGNFDLIWYLALVLNIMIVCLTDWLIDWLLLLRGWRLLFLLCIEFLFL